MSNGKLNQSDSKTKHNVETFVLICTVISTACILEQTSNTTVPIIS